MCSIIIKLGRYYKYISSKVSEGGTCRVVEAGFALYCQITKHLFCSYTSIFTHINQNLRWKDMQSCKQDEVMVENIGILQTGLNHRGENKFFCKFNFAWPCTFESDLLVCSRSETENGPRIPHPLSSRPEVRPGAGVRADSELLPHAQGGPSHFHRAQAFQRVSRVQVWNFFPAFPPRQAGPQNLLRFSRCEVTPFMIVSVRNYLPYCRAVCSVRPCCTVHLHKQPSVHYRLNGGRS